MSRSICWQSRRLRLQLLIVQRYSRGIAIAFLDLYKIAVGGVELLSAAGIDDPGGEILDALNNGTIISLRGAVDSTLEIVDSKNLEKVDELPALKPASSNHNIVSVGYLDFGKHCPEKGVEHKAGV